MIPDETKDNIYEGWHKTAGGFETDIHYFSCIAHNGVVKSICERYFIQEAVSFSAVDSPDDLYACDKCKRIRFEDEERK